MKYSDQQRVQRIYDNDIFDEEHIMKTFARSERRDELMETVKILLKNKKIEVEEIPIFFPKLSMRDVKELEAEISAEEKADS